MSVWSSRLEQEVGRDASWRSSPRGLVRKVACAWAVFLSVWSAAPAPALAETFTFTYSGPNALAGTVVISGSQFRPGIFDITSGTDAVTGGTSLTGTFSIVVNANFPAGAETGRFIYDDALYTGVSPFIDNAGLLFRNASGDVNLYTVGSTYMSGTSTTPAASDQVITVSALTTVPEPASAALLGLAGASLAVIRRRRAA